MGSRLVASSAPPPKIMASPVTLRAGSPRTSTQQHLPCFDGLGETYSVEGLLDMTLSQELHTMEVTESQDLFNLTSLGSQQLLDKVCLSESSELLQFGIS